MSGTVSKWRGIFPALCTPFTSDGDVDAVAQRRVVRFALEAGAHGVVAFGLAGEVLKLAVDERERLLHAIVDEVNGDVPILVGVGAESLRTSRRLACDAEKAGADCIVIPAPIATGADRTELISYFASIAHAVSLPVMIQDAPAYLGIGLGSALVTELGRMAENVRLVKLEAGPADISEWIADLGDEFSVWGGDGGMYQRDCLSAGADGIIPGVDLVDRLVAVYEADASGDHETAAYLFERLLPVLVFEMQSIDHYNACAKRVLCRRGVLERDLLRAPAHRFSDVCDDLLDKHLMRLDL